MKRVVALKEPIVNNVYCGKVWLSWKNWFLTGSTLERYGDPEKKILTLSTLEGLVVLKKNLFLTVSTVWGCGGLDSTAFQQFLLWEAIVVLKELMFNSSIVGGCGSPERTPLLTMSTVGRCSGLKGYDF